jgi:hypothetical protein
MSILQILKIIVAIVTSLTGVVSLFWPSKVQGFTGLSANGGRGITEIRTILGALFFALGAAVLYFNLPATYQMLGIAYLTMAIVRGISMLIDKSVVSSNVISLIVELVAGVILVW